MTDESPAPVPPGSDTPLHDIVAGLVSVSDLGDNVRASASYTDPCGCYVMLIGLIPVVEHTASCPSFSECFVAAVAARAARVATAQAHAFQHGFVSFDSAQHLVLDEIAKYQRELNARARGELGAAMERVSRARAMDAAGVERAELLFGTGVGVATVGAAARVLDDGVVWLARRELDQFHLIYDELNRTVRLLCRQCWPELAGADPRGWEATKVADAMIAHRYAHPQEAS